MKSFVCLSQNVFSFIFFFLLLFDESHSFSVSLLLHQIYYSSQNERLLWTHWAFKSETNALLSSCISSCSSWKSLIWCSSNIVHCSTHYYYDYDLYCLFAVHTSECESLFTFQLSLLSFCSFHSFIYWLHFLLIILPFYQLEFIEKLCKFNEEFFFYAKLWMFVCVLFLVKCKQNACQLNWNEWNGR